MPFAIMYPFHSRGQVGGPRFLLHTKQPLLSHIEPFLPDSYVASGGEGSSKEVFSIRPSQRAFPLTPSPMGPTSSPTCLIRVHR